MAKPVTKTPILTVFIPKTLIIKSPVPQPSKPGADDTVLTAMKSITPQHPLPSQQIS